MKAIIATVITLALIVPAVWSQTEQESSMPEMSPEMQAEMEAWMKLAQPAEHHMHLAPFVGRWKGEVTMWMGPDAQPMVEQSSAEVTWLLGGRYLQWTHSGNYGDMPFEGLAIEGYNNGDKRYESVWMDNFGTVMMFFTGSCSDDGKNRKMNSEFNDVVAGGRVLYSTEYSWVDDDHFSYTAYMDKGDGKFKNLEIEYTRQ